MLLTIDANDHAKNIHDNGGRCEYCSRAKATFAKFIMLALLLKIADEYGQNLSNWNGIHQ